MTDARFHDLIDGLGILICGLDGDGAIHLFNRGCERVTGLAREDAVGLNWLEVFACGQRVPHVVALWAEAREGAPSRPYEALCRNGRNLRWHFSLPAGGGPPLVVLWAVGLDVTDEREALVRARELERVVSQGNLVSGLAHELRNPLNGALLQLAVADRALSRHADERLAVAAAAVDRAKSELLRISDLVDDFLVFARPQPIRVQRIDVREVVERAIERATPRAGVAGVTVRLVPGPETMAEIDQACVESAVYQLITNAIDAAEGADDREVLARIATAGNAVAIEIADGGAGVPADAPMFEPFFTTKHGGTGLGLSIVQRAAADHGGSITHGRRGHVTVFRLELPIVAGGAN
jgi:PAS domain S-box-containing protein